jgi:hypothetical protein
VSPEEIRRISSVLTITRVYVVHAADDYSDPAPPLPPASPDWSPVAAESNSNTRAVVTGASRSARNRHDGCTSFCSIHGHDHANAWTSPLPVQDLKSFWGALGFGCFVF